MYEIGTIFCHKYGMSYFEVHLKEVLADGTKKGANASIPLQDMKFLGVTQTLNGTKKLRAWLESAEGQEYLRVKFA